MPVHKDHPDATDVQCNHCGKYMAYGETYLVVSWMYMTHQDLEQHDEREAEFCKKCATLPLLSIHRQIAK